MDDIPEHKISVEYSITMSIEKHAFSPTKQIASGRIVQRIVKVNGEVSLKEYQRRKVLGKGGFAMCYLTKSLQTSTLYATKIVSKDILKNPRTRYKLENEIKLHKTLHHQNIVEVYNSFEDDHNVYIFLELCPNESLNQLILKKKRLKIPEVQRYTRQIINAVKYLHSREVIHRDLKLGNIFLGEKFEIKLGDFGLATKLEFLNEKKRSICGTPNYIAPEIISGKGYSYSVDIWSIGVIIYTLLVGIPPFETDNVSDTYELIKNNTYSFPQSVYVHQTARRLISQILCTDPSKRPTLDDILDSPFMKLGKSTAALKELSTNYSLNKSTQLPQQQISDVLDSSKRKQQFKISVLKFHQIEGGFVYGMTNGVIAAQIGNRLMLYSKMTDSYYHVVRNSNAKDTLVKETQEFEQTEETQKLKRLILKSRYIIKDSVPDGSLVYIRKFIKHKDFFMFRLSNQLVQLKFDDGCLALINKYLTITFYTEGRPPICGCLQDLEGFNNQLFSKKSKYIKQMVEILSAKRSKY